MIITNCPHCQKLLNITGLAGALKNQVKTLDITCSECSKPIVVLPLNLQSSFELFASFSNKEEAIQALLENMQGITEQNTVRQTEAHQDKATPQKGNEQPLPTKVPNGLTSRVDRQTEGYIPPTGEVLAGKREYDDATGEILSEASVTTTTKQRKELLEQNVNPYSGLFIKAGDPKPNVDFYVDPTFNELG